MIILRINILAIALTVLMAISAQAQTWLTNGLVAYYPFNGNANDASGNGYHLQNNGATYGADNLGAANSAAYFDSGSARPPAGDGDNNFGGQWMSFGSAHPLTGLTNLTIAIWIRPQFFYRQAFGNSAAQWILFQESVVAFKMDNYTQEVLGFFVGYGSIGSWDLPSVYIANNTFGFSTNSTWVHCVYTANASGQFLFVNGALATSTTNGISAVGSNGYMLGLGAYFNGGIDNLRFYNRALSSNEAAFLYYYESRKQARLVKAYTIDFEGLAIGTNYQLQVSTNLLSWTNWGAPFTATSDRYTNTIPYQRAEDWTKLFFRLQQQ